MSLIWNSPKRFLNDSKSGLKQFRRNNTTSQKQGFPAHLLFQSLIHRYIVTIVDIGPCTGPILDLCWVRLLHPVQCPEFFKKYFHQKWLKVTSVQGMQAKKMPFFQKRALKNASMPSMSSIGAAVTSRIWFIVTLLMADSYYPSSQAYPSLMLWGPVMPLIYMRENIPLKQNERVRRVFLPMLQKKRNISLTQIKFSTRVLY